MCVCIYVCVYVVKGASLGGDVSPPRYVCVSAYMYACMLSRKCLWEKMSRRLGMYVCMYVCVSACVYACMCLGIWDDFRWFVNKNLLCCLSLYVRDSDSDLDI
jgi:hypothetical protein